MINTRDPLQVDRRKGWTKRLRLIMAVSTVGLLPLELLATAGSMPPGQAQAVSYTGQDKIAEIPHLAALPQAVLEERLSGWREAFVGELSSNQAIVSDAALLILEALLRQDSDAASTVLQRYGAGKQGAGALFPEPLQDSLSPRDAIKLTRLAAKRTMSTEEGVNINLHPFWWSEPGCRVAINGVPVIDRQGTVARGGTTFYVQRVCPQARLNRLATGTVPQGRDTLFIAFRATEADDDAALRDRDADRLLVGGLIGPLWGHQGSVGLSSGSRPPLFLGLRLASEKGWSFQIGGAGLSRSAVDEEEPTTGAAFQADDAEEERLFSRIIVERRFLFSIGNGLLGRVAVGPLLGAGVSGLHMEGHSASDWEFLAPTAALGAEVLWQIRLADEHELEVGFRPALTVASPPLRGVTREVFLVLGVTF